LRIFGGIGVGSQASKMARVVRRKLAYLNFRANCASGASNGEKYGDQIGWIPRGSADEVQA